MSVDFLSECRQKSQESYLSTGETSDVIEVNNAKSRVPAVRQRTPPVRRAKTFLPVSHRRYASTSSAAATLR